MSLRYKIFFGYAILMAVIGSMAAILIYERQRMREIEAETANINLVRRGINTAHRRITGLATLGEGVVNWNKADYLYYRNHRLQADSLLNSLKRHCREYVRPEQIDTLRALLAEKETHLLHIMEMFERRTEADSVLVNRLPEVARRATHIRTIEQKKKGIAGFFGKKEEIQVMPSQKELHDFSDSLIAIHQRQANEMDIYADSLRMRNRELNRTLNKLINDLDEQAQTAFSQRELKMAEAEKMSFFLMAGVIGMAIILLIISHLIIMRDLNRRERDKAELEDTATQNRTLSDMRKKIIITLSHDIRGPLNAISGSAELPWILVTGNAAMPISETSLNHPVISPGLPTACLTSPVLDDAKETLNEIPFHLESFLESIAEEYTRKANDKGLMFDKAFMGCGITVLGDADRIRQIVVNILENAVKFTRTGYIKFLASYEEDTLSVKVKDTGIGMGENTTQRIFQPFERAAPDLDSEGFGFGTFHYERAGEPVRRKTLCFEPDR
ncbi:HAMP domain-containing histidine kinase [Bacteroides uniformis]|nr:HAMP domain-containing histidine kinase [Bacteroides uniformis]